MMKAWPYLTVGFLCNDGEKDSILFIDIGVLIYRHGCTWEGTDGDVASWSSLNIVSIFLEKKETSEEWRQRREC